MKPATYNINENKLQTAQVIIVVELFDEYSEIKQQKTVYITESRTGPQFSKILKR